MPFTESRCLREKIFAIIMRER